MDYRVVVTACKDNILVERQLHIVGEQWKTIDRYTTKDLRSLPKRRDKWIRDFVGSRLKETPVLIDEYVDNTLKAKEESLRGLHVEHIVVDEYISPAAEALGDHLRDQEVEAFKQLVTEGQAVTEEPLHYVTQEGQSYGSVSRCCSWCGAMCWMGHLGSAERWTNDFAEWKKDSNTCRRKI